MWQFDFLKKFTTIYSSSAPLISAQFLYGAVILIITDFSVNLRISVISAVEMGQFLKLALCKSFQIFVSGRIIYDSL